MKASTTILITILLFSSCTSKVKIKREVFEKITFGWDTTEVKKLLGEPHKIRHTPDSGVDYYYIREASLTGNGYSLVRFAKDGFFESKHYIIPD